MSRFLPSLIGSGGASNDLTKTKTLNILERHTEEKADGTRTTTERTLEHFDSVHCEGSEWLVPQGSRWNGKGDRSDEHFRTDRKLTIARETTTILDKNGNKTIDEKAVKKEDNWSSHGTMLISDEPEFGHDDRGLLLDNFSSGSNPFKLLGSGKDFTPLIGEDKNG